ncbi:acetate/propionate family kinase [Mucilaginibacter phyllosphaerae]
MNVKTDACILVVNGGSSSIKYAVYRKADLTEYYSGTIVTKATAEVINLIKEKTQQTVISAIVHRLVQGGPEHMQPELVTTKLIDKLKSYIYLAPNHLPGELKLIKAFQSAFKNIPQVACFDTAFHKDIPSWIRHYPLPETYQKMGLMKYGFHGLSYQYILQKLITENPNTKKQKIIIAHLGNGASMAAIKNGISVDTTMGLSPTGGLVMGTRSGDLDPGVTLFLLKTAKLTPTQLDELLNKNSGMKAIAGQSDVRELLKAENDDPKAAEALQVFCYTARKFIGSLAAGLGGLDQLIFTGGIGENSATIRTRICEGLEFMEIELNQTKNKDNSPLISTNASRVKVQVIKTNEALMMARLASNLLMDKKNNKDGNEKI